MWPPAVSPDSGSEGEPCWTGRACGSHFPVCDFEPLESRDSACLASKGTVPRKGLNNSKTLESVTQFLQILPRALCEGREQEYSCDVYPQESAE